MKIGVVHHWIIHNAQLVYLNCQDVRSDSSHWNYCKRTKTTKKLNHSPLSLYNVCKLLSMGKCATNNKKLKIHRKGDGNLKKINCELYQSRDFRIFSSSFGGKTDANLSTLSHSIQWINTNKWKIKSSCVCVCVCGWVGVCVCACVCVFVRERGRVRNKLNLVEDDFAYFDDVCNSLKQLKKVL